MEDLRKKLEQLPELRELVRKLGRSGGKGPKRRAPEEVPAVPDPSRFACTLAARSAVDRTSPRRCGYRGGCSAQP